MHHPLLCTLRCRFSSVGMERRSRERVPQTLILFIALCPPLLFLLANSVLWPKQVRRTVYCTFEDREAKVGFLPVLFFITVLTSYLSIRSKLGVPGLGLRTSTSTISGGAMESSSSWKVLPLDYVIILRIYKSLTSGAMESAKRDAACVSRKRLTFASRRSSLFL